MPDDTGLTCKYVMGDSDSLGGTRWYCGLFLQRASEGPCETCGVYSISPQGHEARQLHAYLGPWACPVHGVQP